MNLQVMKEAYPMKEPNKPEASPTTNGSEKITAHESSADLSYQSTTTTSPPVNLERDLTLNHQDAQGGSPDDIAACGEEDIGAGLEFLVSRENEKEEHEGDGKDN